METNHLNFNLLFLTVCVFSVIIDDVCGNSINRKQSESSRHIRDISDIQEENMSNSKTSTFRENYFGSDPDHQKQVYENGLEAIRMLEERQPKRSATEEQKLSLKNLIHMIHETSNRIRSLTKMSKPDMDDDNGVRIKTVVKTWSKNDPRHGRDNVISGYKTEVGNPKRAGRLSINGALSSLADLLVSENQRKDRLETMELRRRLQYLG